MSCACAASCIRVHFILVDIHLSIVCRCECSRTRTCACHHLSETGDCAGTVSTHNMLHATCVSCCASAMRDRWHICTSSDCMHHSCPYHISCSVTALALTRGPGGLRQYDSSRGNKKYKMDLEASLYIPKEMSTTGEREGGEMLGVGGGTTSASTSWHDDARGCDIMYVTLPFSSRFRLLARFRFRFDRIPRT